MYIYLYTQWITFYTLTLGVNRRRFSIGLSSPGKPVYILSNESLGKIVQLYLIHSILSHAHSFFLTPFFSYFRMFYFSFYYKSALVRSLYHLYFSSLHCFSFIFSRNRVFQQPIGLWIFISYLITLLQPCKFTWR